MAVYNLKANITDFNINWKKIKDKLSPRERDVIRLHLGLDDNRQRTAEQIAELFGNVK